MNIRKFALLTNAAALAFNPNGGWKLDADGKIEVDTSGNPILIVNGAEQTVRPDTVTRFGNEARDNRQRAEAAETALKAFEGLDAAKARDALEKLSKIDTKALIDAGEVDRVRQEISQGFAGQLAEKDNALARALGQVDSLTIAQAFGQSKFIAENIAVPPEMFTSTIGKNFKVEDGKVIPYDLAGNKVYSKTNHGEVATVDEAFDLIVSGYQYKDQILKAPNSSGSGNSGNGGNNSGGRTIRRSEFEAMPPHKQAEIGVLAGKGEMKIVD